jgi:hypothetical protein
MLFDKINIKEELIKKRDHPEKALLLLAKDFLRKASRKDSDVWERLKKEDNKISINHWMLDEADNQNLFSLSDIKEICVKYRLRFLDSSLFKSEIPYEAIANINAFEEKHGQKLEKFKIIAPDSVFKLQDINKDPLLFGQLSDNRYLLIHKWGNDLAWYRNIFHLPFKNIYTYFVFVLILAATIAFSLPESWITFNPESIIYLRLWLTVHSLIGLFGFLLFIGATFNFSFSESNWNSKYFNG